MMPFHLTKDISDVVLPIAAAVKLKGGRALIVGGWVRDQILKEPSMDVDMEVYGMSMEDLEDTLILLQLDFDPVGRSFGILKLCAHNVDISIPRRENRIGVNHTDFE